MVIYFLSLLRGVWVYTPYWGIIIVGSVLPSKKVLNSQRPRPAKPLGPRALRIPPSIPDLQNYSGVSNSFSSSPSRNSPSTPSFSASFLLAHPSLCLNPSETRRQTFQSPRKYCYALLFNSPPPDTWLTVLSHQQYAPKHARKQRPYLFSCPTAWSR